MAAARGGGETALHVLKYDDVSWERDRRGNQVTIGRGAFGTVFAGVLHGQQVAIKAEVLEEGEEAAWTKAARLHYTATCPNIVAMHGIIVDHEGGKVTHYLVMERLAGTMTALVLKPGGTHYGADMGLRLALLSNVAGGLAYLHAASVIHADVKPDNVLLTAVSQWSPFPIAKLADFGSSVQRRAGTRTHGTLVGERGTLVYMDPCLLDRSASITAASDVYSFGIMAWQVLSGLPPYEAELRAAAPATALEAERLLKAHVCGPRGKRPPVSLLAERGVPPAVVALVESCWAPGQGDRPAMADVQSVLEAAAAAMGSRAGAAGGSGGGGGRGPVAAPAPAPPAVLHVVPAAAPRAAAAPPAAPTVAPAPVRAPTAVVAAPLAYEWGDNVVLAGHNTNVWSLALLLGGRLASGDGGGTVRLWDAVRGGEATAVLDGHGGPVRALAALPGGRRLAAGVCSSDGKVGSVVVWDTGIVPPTRCVTIACSSGVYALAMLRGSHLAAGCHDGGVRLVEVGAGAGAVSATLEGHTRVVGALAVLPKARLASGSHDKTVRVWNMIVLECVATLAGHTDIVNALAVLADGRLASGSSDMSVRLWDVATLACVAVLKGHTNWVTALAALPDGRLASGSWDKTIRVWDTRPGAVEATTGIMALVTRLWRTTPVVVLDGYTHWAYALQPLPGGRLASGSGDKTVRLWRVPPP